MDEVLHAVEPPPSAVAEIHRPPDEARWLACRDLLGTFGASEVADLCGQGPGTAWEVWARHRGLLPPRSRAELPEWLEWGHRLQPEIARAFAARTGRQVRDMGRYTIYRSRALPLHVTPDYPIFDAELGWGLLECKNWRSLKADRAFADEETEENASDRTDVSTPPAGPLVQVQAGLLATGFAWGAVAVLEAGQKLHLWEVRADPAFQATLAAAVTEMARRVAENDPPAAEGRSLDALKRAYPADDGTEVVLPPAFAEHHARLAQAKAEIGRWTGAVADLKALFEAALGGHARGWLPDGGAYRWATTRRGRTLTYEKPTAARQAAAQTWGGNT